MNELVLEMQTIAICARCSRAYPIGMHGEICDVCYAVAKCECTECGAEFTRGFLANGEVDTTSDTCAECTYVCWACNEPCTGNTVTVSTWDCNNARYNDSEVCESCSTANYSSCSDCGNLRNNDSIVPSDGDSICEDCREDYRECDRCGGMTHIDNTCYDKDSDSDYCESCFRVAEAENSNSVHSWSYTPPVRFFGANGQQVYNPTGFSQGLELECGWKNGYTSGYADQVNAALGEICYLKEDGTITQGTGLEGGFEIVTHPCHIEHYRNVLRGICDKKIPGLLSHSTDNAGCGLHISANKSALTNHAIARICAFIGADRNEAWIVKLARRKSDRWAKIVKKESVEDTLERTSDGYEFLKINHSDRYEAVNLQNSSHVEFRLFRGTLKYSSLMLCIEFVNALCMWCMESADVADYQSGAKLLEFAKDFPETYPHLIEFLCANL